MQALMQYKIPNIVMLHDVYLCDKDDVKYITLVMQLCEANVYELIQQRALS